nr:hypothetical protein [Tanacetum cinerariifolium]
EMTKAEDADTRNSDEEITDTAKPNAKKTKEVKDDIKKVELPPTSSSLSVSLGFGNQFLNLSSDTSLIEDENTTTLHALLKSEIPPAVNAYLGSSLGDELHKVLQKHTKELIQKYPQQVDYKEMIKESMQVNIINEVKNELPKFLPNAASDFATLGKKTKRSRTKKFEPLKTSSTSKESSKGSAHIDELRTTLINFSKYAMSRIKIDNLT